MNDLEPNEPAIGDFRVIQQTLAGGDYTSTLQVCIYSSYQRSTWVNVPGKILGYSTLDSVAVTLRMTAIHLLPAPATEAPLHEEPESISGGEASVDYSTK